MRQVAAALVAAITAFAPGGATLAVPISQFVTFSGSSFDAESVLPFDTTLGTLVSVEIGIEGALTVTGLEPQFLVGAPVPVPTPYGYTVEVEQQFFGLAGKYFTFADPARFVFNRVATGAGGGFAFTANFTYGFAFTAASDLAGVVVPMVSTTPGALIPPLSGIVAQRADFFDDGIPLNEIDMVQSAAATAMAPVTVTISNFDTTARMEIRYNYTPAVAEAPAPGSAVLLLLAGGALLRARRHTRRLRLPARITSC